MNTTVIIPIHEFNDKVKGYLDKSLKSVQNQKVKPSNLLMVMPKEICNDELKDFIKNYTSQDLLIDICVHESKTDFASQVNLGVENVKTEYFSILEYDDEFSDVYFKHVLEHQKSYPNVSMFMPIVVEVIDTDNTFVKFSNEAVWSKSFVSDGELGFLQHNSVMQYPNFLLSGAIFKVEDYKEVGGIKSNIKLSFIVEFFLRITNQDKKIMTIPRIGYLHRIAREGSLFDNYKKTISPDEAQFWFNTAKKEFYFTQDRELEGYVI